MKIYIDLAKQAITKTSDEKVYEGDFYSNVFEVLFYNYENENWFPTMSQLAPNGRRAGDFTADALGVGESHTYVEDGTTYLRFTFTMGATWVLMKGRSEFYIWFNRIGGSIVQKKCVGRVNVMIDQSTDNYFIADPLFNPAVKTYIDACVAEIGDGSPKYFDTAANIALLTEDKGLAVATDTGYIYVWNDTQQEYVNTGMKYIADVSLFYTKTQSDNTFAPKSTAITHTGNQLQDYSGNNVYPNLDDGQVSASKLASNSVETGKIKDGAVTSEKLASGVLNYLTSQMSAQLPNEVNDWLVAHPEATTTVQDGSITEAKLANALKLKVIKEYATPEMFGAVGDGVTNDTTAITSCMWYCYTNKVPCLCTKVYAVNKKIDISFDCYMSKDSKIIALEQPYNSQNEKQPLVLLGAYQTVGAEFKINVDANSVCDIAVDVSLCRKCKIDIWAYNFIDKGVYNGRTDSGNNENIFNIWAYGINGGTDKSNYGVYLTSGDSVYGDIVTVDCITGVYTSILLKANSIHCWLKDGTYFNNSICLDVVSSWTNNQIQIGYFYQDGVKTGIKMTSEASICIDLFTYVPPYSFAYDENDVKHLLLKSSSTVVINNTRIRLGSNYNDYGIFKFTKDSKYGVFVLGRNNGENYSTTGRYKFADLDTLPDAGTFSVDNVTAPVNGTNVTVICTATGNAKQQIILYGGEIYIRFWQLGSSNSWGSWRKVENTIVS